jgi:hypothetical protein
VRGGLYPSAQLLLFPCRFLSGRASFLFGAFLRRYSATRPRARVRVASELRETVRRSGGARKDGAKKGGGCLSAPA